ncbi:hypothetical protein D3C77_681500 [compost metagenome]
MSCSRVNPQIFMRVRMTFLPVAQREAVYQYIGCASGIQVPGWPNVEIRESKLPSATRNHGTSLFRKAVMLS